MRWSLSEIKEPELPPKGSAAWGIRVVRLGTTLLLANFLNPIQAQAQWKTSTTKDPITDEVKVVFSVTSTTPVPNAAGIPGRATLVVRCAGGEFEDLYVATNTYVGEGVKVQYRIDGGPVREEQWTGGRAQDALFLDPGSAELFWLTATVITKGRQLVFRWFPPREDARTAVFTTAGFSALPQSALAACGEDRASIAKRGATQRREDSLRALRVALRATLESNDSSLPWASSKIGGSFWRNVATCADAKFYRGSPNLIFFRTEEDALALGRRRSTEEGC